MDESKEKSIENCSNAHYAEQLTMHTMSIAYRNLTQIRR